MNVKLLTFNGQLNNPQKSKVNPGHISDSLPTLDISGKFDQMKSQQKVGGKY